MDRNYLESLTVDRLKELAWEQLVTVTSKRKLKRDYVEALLNPTRDYSKLPIDRLRDYIRTHQLLLPREDQPKERYIEVIEKQLKPEKKKMVVHENKEVSTANLWFEVLLRVHPSIVFRLASIYKLAARLSLMELYWKRRYEREQLPSFRPWTYRQSYLEWTRYPIAADTIFAWGDNSYGQLGFITKKHHIDIENQQSPVVTRVVDICNLAGQQTIFLRDDRSAWSCGFGAMDWEEQYDELEKKVKHAPHPMILPKIKQGIGFGIYFIFISNVDDQLYSWHSRGITTAETRLTKLSDKRYSVLHNDGKEFIAVRNDGVQERYKTVSTLNTQLVMIGSHPVGDVTYTEKDIASTEISFSYERFGSHFVRIIEFQ